MIIGVSAQIVLGNLIGVIWVMEIHVILRFLTAASCALMYTAGSMICKFKIQLLTLNNTLVENIN